jgi:hypothetical protein
MQRYKAESLNLRGYYRETPHGRFDQNQKHSRYPGHAIYMFWARQAMDAYRSVKTSGCNWCDPTEALTHYANDARHWLRVAREYRQSSK